MHKKSVETWLIAAAGFVLMVCCLGNEFGTPMSGMQAATAASR